MLRTGCIENSLAFEVPYNKNSRLASTRRRTLLSDSPASDQVTRRNFPANQAEKEVRPIAVKYTIVCHQSQYENGGGCLRRHLVV